MKLFYIITGVIVATLAVVPVLLVKGSGATKDDGRIVTYSTYGSKVRSLDPASASDTLSASVQGNFYESLYTYHYLKRPVELIPQLAADMPQVSDDGLTYTIPIKKGVYYRRSECFDPLADGRRTRGVTAEDFVLAFKRIADYHVISPLALPFIEDKVEGLKEYRDRTRAYGRGDFRRYFARNADGSEANPLTGVVAVDEHTLRIKLTQPFPQLMYVLALNNFAPIPHELVEYFLANPSIPENERSPEINDLRAAVGTGPYYLTKFDFGGGDLILERNPDFRDDLYPCDGASPQDIAEGLTADCGKKVPFVDVQHWFYVPEVNPSWNMFLARQTDVSGIPSQVFHMVVTPGSQLTDRWNAQGIRLMKYMDPAVYWYVFNLQDKYLGNSRSLRQAMSLAFDVETYLDVLYNGRGARATNVVPTDFPEDRDLPVSPYARYDLAAAREKMKDAYNELVAAGVLAPGEKLPPLTLSLPGREEDDRKVGEFAKYQFKQIGIELKIDLMDWPTLQEKMEKKQLQIFGMGWHADYPDPENFLQLYYGPNIERMINQSNYRNAEFDRLYDQAARMMPSPARTEIYKRMTAILNEDCPVLLLTEPVSLILVQPWVHNVKPHPIGYGMYKYRRIDVQMRDRLRQQ
jgi:ABC-type transport system substrate-binding protein